MSRGAVILVVLLCVAVAGIIFVSKKRSSTVDTTPPVAQTTDTTPPGGTDGSGTTRPPSPNVVTVAPPTPRSVDATSATPSNGVGRTTIAAANPNSLTRTQQAAAFPPGISLADTNEPGFFKPLPELEKNYASSTNRDARLDIMMDISENPSAEAVRALTRLFELETDPDLKVDLLDSLLGIEGFKDEKLIMLTMGSRPGLPADVRQSAIDGLIDLDDQRVVPILNGLLNDPDPEIREGAQDALDMLQAEPAPTVKIIGIGK